MSFSTLRAPISRASLTSLTDDSLLVILRYLSVPQLLIFLSLSRRLNSLIVQCTLPAYRTIHLPNLPSIVISLAKYQLLRPFIFFSRRYYSHSSFYVPANFETTTEREEPSHFLSVPLFKSQLSSFSLDLPRLLCRLQSLTFSYFFGNNCLLSKEENRVNLCLTVYLQSSWSQTLVSLKLYIVEIGNDSSSPDDHLSHACLFGQLAHFPSLKHLFLHFRPYYYPTPGTHLPDSLPVLSQLHSFSLHWYEGSNTVTLLHQLGPNLIFLSLCHANCPPEDVLSFLCSQPSYKSTLTTVEFNLGPIRGSQWSTLINSFPALVHLSGNFDLKSDSLFPFFTLLSRLSQLREMLIFGLSIENLRALRDAYPLHRLPTLPSIRRLSLHIQCSRTDRIDIQAGELFNEHLPLLGAIFGAAEKVEVMFSFMTLGLYVPLSIPLSRQLADKVKEHFPSVRSCEARNSYPTFDICAS